VLRALECFEQPVVLIMGGLDKGGDFKLLEAGVQRRVKALVLIGKAAVKIRGELAGAVHTLDAASMAHAVETAAAISRSGDAVLLAPGCASFDMYQNYQARGEDFRQAVLKLKAQAGGPPGRGQRPESEGP
jgi:UDP-N-acetylmuramoylalanine--D-glutamate ligase